MSELFSNEEKPNKLRGKRVELGFSQAEVAVQLHVCRYTYQKIERGKIPDLYLAIRIASLFKTTIEDLFPELFK